MPTFNSSNPWRTQKPRSAPPSPPHRPSASSSSTRRPPPPNSEPLEQEDERPQNERAQRLRQLAQLRDKFTSLRTSFSPPPLSHLVYLPTSTSLSPKLAFTSPNAPVHGYEESLTRLLTELDGVESGGDLEVRGERKKLVVEVERELERVEREVRRRGWEVQNGEGVKEGGEGEGQARSGGNGGAVRTSRTTDAQKNAPSIAPNEATSRSLPPPFDRSSTSSSSPSHQPFPPSSRLEGAPPGLAPPSHTRGRVSSTPSSGSSSAHPPRPSTSSKSRSPSRESLPSRQRGEYQHPLDSLFSGNAHANGRGGDNGRRYQQPTRVQEPDEEREYGDRWARRGGSGSAPSPSPSAREYGYGSAGAGERWADPRVRRGGEGGGGGYGGGGWGQGGGGGGPRRGYEGRGGFPGGFW
ncbi:hypothetical protein JCM11251_007098 [Rhodosporidiobolus azoricus]